MPAPEPIPLEESDAIMADLCVLALCPCVLHGGMPALWAQVVNMALQVFCPCSVTDAIGFLGTSTCDMWRVRPVP